MPPLLWEETALVKIHLPGTVREPDSGSALEHQTYKVVFQGRLPAQLASYAFKASHLSSCYVGSTFSAKLQ